MRAGANSGHGRPYCTFVNTRERGHAGTEYRPGARSMRLCVGIAISTRPAQRRGPGTRCNEPHLSRAVSVAGRRRARFLGVRPMRRARHTFCSFGLVGAGAICCCSLFTVQGTGRPAHADQTADHTLRPHVPAPTPHFSGSYALAMLPSGGSARGKRKPLAAEQATNYNQHPHLPASPRPHASTSAYRRRRMRAPNASRASVPGSGAPAGTGVLGDDS